MSTPPTGSVVKGFIGMFSGAINGSGNPVVDGVPNTEWALCDGGNGTPDLRDKFVKSVGAGEQPGGSGGSATHTHDAHPALTHAGAAVANHVFTQAVNHIFTQPAAHSNHVFTQAAAHTVVATKQGAAAGNVVTTATHTGSGVDAHSAHTGGAVDAHSGAGVNAHSGAGVDAHQVTQPDQHAAQSHSVASNEPAYYKLAYIMRL